MKRKCVAHILKCAATCGMLPRVARGKLMKKTVAVAILSLISTLTTALAQSPASPAERVTVIRAGSLIDGTSGSPRKSQLIFVRGNRIEKVADASAQIPAGATRIELSDPTLAPRRHGSPYVYFLLG